MSEEQELLEAKKLLKLSSEWLEEVCNQENEELRLLEGVAARGSIESFIFRLEKHLKEVEEK